MPNKIQEIRIFEEKGSLQETIDAILDAGFTLPSLNDQTQLSISERIPFGVYITRTAFVMRPLENYSNPSVNIGEVDLTEESLRNIDGVNIKGMRHLLHMCCGSINLNAGKPNDEVHFVGVRYTSKTESAPTVPSPYLDINQWG